MIIARQEKGSEFRSAGSKRSMTGRKWERGDHAPRCASYGLATGSIMPRGCIRFAVGAMPSQAARSPRVLGTGIVIDVQCPLGSAPANPALSAYARSTSQLPDQRALARMERIDRLPPIGLPAPVGVRTTASAAVIAAISSPYRSSTSPMPWIAPHGLQRWQPNSSHVCQPSRCACPAQRSRKACAPATRTGQRAGGQSRGGGIVAS